MFIFLFCTYMLFYNSYIYRTFLIVSIHWVYTVLINIHILYIIFVWIHVWFHVLLSFPSNPLSLKQVTLINQNRSQSLDEWANQTKWRGIKVSVIWKVYRNNSKLFLCVHKWILKTPCTDEIFSAVTWLTYYIYNWKLHRIFYFFDSKFFLFVVLFLVNSLRICFVFVLSFFFGYV